MLIPSSNSALEPLCAHMVARLEHVSVHAGRVRTSDSEQILAGADVLADARVGAIAWSGTSSGWLGFERDRVLAMQIESRTGIPATTAPLALLDALAVLRARRIAFVTPYEDDVQANIIVNFSGAGHETVAERHLRLRDTFSCEIAPETLAEMIRGVARSGPDAIAVFCTNLRAAQLVSSLETELGIPIFDTVAISVWAALGLAGADPARVAGWGRLFSLPVPPRTPALRSIGAGRERTMAPADEYGARRGA